MKLLTSSAAVLAALATLATPAAAQSSVTIYGRVDLGLFKQNSGTTPINAGNGQTGPAANRWEIKQGSAGRVGFRGVEDLGGGLKTSFILEHRFQADTGAAENPFFQARSFVELGGKDWGAVYAGREYFPIFWPALRLDPWGFDSVGTPGPKHQFANYTVDGGIRSNNTIGYKTPNWGGITANLAMSAGEGARSNSNGANVEYTAGPVYLAAAFDKVDERQKVSLVGGAYDFGVVRPALTVVRSTVAGVKNKNVTLTARIPVTSGVVKLGVARLDPDGPGNTNTRVGMGYEHFLSKRTSILGNVGTAKQDGRTRTTLFDLTLKHNF
jgi:predicted porin